MNTTAPMPICEICNLRRGIMIKALPGAAVSVAACRPCHNAGAIPIWVAVAQTVAIGGMECAAPWWEYVIHDTLEHLNVDISEFNHLVRQYSIDLAEAP